MVLLVLKCHMALWHKWHKLMLLVTLHDLFSADERTLVCLGVSIIFSSVGMSLGSAKYDTYAL